MRWLNQANWDLATKNYGLEDLLFLANHFKDTLDETGFNKDNLKSEWKSLRRMVNQNYASVKCPLSMWLRILSYRASEFKNVCSVAEICLCIGASNSTVETGFTLLSNILTDKRLRSSHKGIENCLLVAANSVNFTSAECNQIINDAVNKYLQKKRKLPSSTQQKKRRCLLPDSDDSDEEDLSNLKEAADAAVARAGDTVDLSSNEDEDKILDADESDKSDVENNNAEENQAVEDEDVNDEEVSEVEDAF